jgi:hypothetical protein
LQDGLVLELDHVDLLVDLLVDHSVEVEADLQVLVQQQGLLLWVQLCQVLLQIVIEVM